MFALTFFFNARQEVWGPANAGWTAAWPTMKVAAVTPSGPMDKAGVRVGDVLEAADEQPLTAMSDWFVARAHFERDRPINLRIIRDNHPLYLHFVITEPALRAWNKAQLDGVLALLLVRLILLSLAIFLGFSRSGRQPSARVAALMLAVGAVAEGYPSAGWAAALGHLPAFVAIPVCLASVSCLLAPIIWFAFLCELHPFPTPARVGSDRLAGADCSLWTPDVRVVHRDDPCTVSHGRTLVNSAFRSGATDSRHCRRHSIVVSKRVAVLSADWAYLAVTDVAGDDSLVFCSRLPHSFGNLFPRQQYRGKAPNGGAVCRCHAVRIHHSPKHLCAKLDWLVQQHAAEVLCPNHLRC